MDWARTVDAGGVGKKAVLKELAYRAHGADHSCEVSQRELADATGQGERTVRRQLAELEDEQLVRREAQPRARGRGRWVDRYYLAVVDAGGENYTTAETADQPATHADQPASHADQPANGGRWIGDLEDQEQPPRVVLPSRLEPAPTRRRDRWAPKAEQLCALPGPSPCDEWDQARGHPECRRIGELILDAASERAELPLAAFERKRLREAVAELVQAGHAPEALATAIADAPTRTPAAITLQLRRVTGPRRIGRSAGADTVEAAKRWIAAGGS